MLDCFDTFHEKAYSEQGLTQGLVCCCLFQQTDHIFLGVLAKNSISTHKSVETMSLQKKSNDV